MDADDLYRTKFVPDSPYENYIQKDLNFEDYCYRCAVLGEVMHTYVPLKDNRLWIHMTMLPVKSDRENIYYCTYTQEFTKTAETKMLVNLSPEISNAVLSTCIKLRSAKDFHETMNEIIQDIQKMCNAEHCCVFLTDYRQRTCSVLCEALGKDTKLKSMEVYVDDVFFENVVSTWEDTIGTSTCLVINDAGDWETLKQRNPAWYDSMRMAGAESLVLYPLRARGETLGYIWAINFDTSLTVRIRETLELTTFFIASEIAGYQLFRRLETLSSVDLLTGVYNRNAMNNRIDALCAGAETIHDAVGIVFADLNGLKQVNDDCGHSAGDTLLKHAAEILRNLFPDDEIYRAGGDEFMIISMNSPETKLLRQVQMLRDYPDNPEHVSFAVGFCYDADCSCIRRAMHLADERMYANKEEYYQKHPEKRRK